MRAALAAICLLLAPAAQAETFDPAKDVYLLEWRAHFACVAGEVTELADPMHVGVTNEPEMLACEAVLKECGDLYDVEYDFHVAEIPADRIEDVIACSVEQYDTYKHILGVYYAFDIIADYEDRQVVDMGMSHVIDRAHASVRDCRDRLSYHRQTLADISPRYITAFNALCRSGDMRFRADGMARNLMQRSIARRLMGFE